MNNKFELDKKEVLSQINTANTIDDKFNKLYDLLSNHGFKSTILHCITHMDYEFYEAIEYKNSLSGFEQQVIEFLKQDPFNGDLQFRGKNTYPEDQYNDISNKVHNFIFGHPIDNTYRANLAKAFIMMITIDKNRSSLDFITTKSKIYKGLITWC